MLIPYSFVPYFILFSVFYFYLLELYSLRAYKYVDKMNGNHKKIIRQYLSTLLISGGIFLASNSRKISSPWPPSTGAFIASNGGQHSFPLHFEAWRSWYITNPELERPHHQPELPPLQTWRSHLSPHFPQKRFSRSLSTASSTPYEAWRPSLQWNWCHVLDF